jgi:flagellar basal body P-ring formation protein FlgA
MKRIIHSLLAVLALLTSCLSFAQTSSTHQDLGELRSVIKQFLLTQASGLPGKVSIEVGHFDLRLNLAACISPEPFLPKGSRPWGKTSVGIRCSEPTPWTIYVKATVKAYGEYVAAATPLTQGQVITASDLVKARGDLATLPTGVITDISQAIGQKIAMAIQQGAPIRKDLLRSQQAIQAGQVVRLVSIGSGFKISTEGKAMGSANEGQTVQTRTTSGQTVSGIARIGGVVEVSF